MRNCGGGANCSISKCIELARGGANCGAGAKCIQYNLEVCQCSGQSREGSGLRELDSHLGNHNDILGLTCARHQKRVTNTKCGGSGFSRTCSKFQACTDTIVWYLPSAMSSWLEITKARRHVSSRQQQLKDRAASDSEPATDNEAATEPLHQVWLRMHGIARDMVAMIEGVDLNLERSPLGISGTGKLSTTQTNTGIRGCTSSKESGTKCDQSTTVNQVLLDRD